MKDTSLPLSKGVAYYINGKKVTYEQVKELDSDSIVKVEIKKKPKKGEVHISTKQ